MYSIRHITKFEYSSPVAESVMEVRMEPLTDERQRCVRFDLDVRPRARAYRFCDHLGNAVHHFDVAAAHEDLVLTAESVAEVFERPPLPESLPECAWAEIDRTVESGEHWDYLHESRFIQSTPALRELSRALDISRRGDPLTCLKRLNQDLYDWFEYAPNSTKVDSPIDDALERRAGVCQDFAHIMVTLVREMGIPARYVSGYLHHGHEDHDRSQEDASHAWVECLLPELGWVGLDPTNALLVNDRHIRIASGRDYADVPPTRGVFKGDAKTELSVAVRVAPGPKPAPPDEAEQELSRGTAPEVARAHARAIQQQQQQQQQ